MKLLLVTSVDAWTRSVSTIHHLVAAGLRAGHQIAVFGEADADLPGLPFTTETEGVDLALFVVQVPGDLPDMPGLAHIIDRVPRARRAVVDLWGRYNDTIRLDHDFNHLEKLDGHLGWEWDEAFRAISATICQPTLAPRRADVGSFLFHGFESGAVIAATTDAAAAARHWRDGARPHGARPYGLRYVGSNWQRWHQVRQLLEGYAAARDEIGPASLVGWDWGERPGWAVDKGLAGIDTDPDFLGSLGVEIRNGVRFDEVVGLLGEARFAPVIHRPLFRALGFVTARSFETFHADTVPVLLLPRDFVEAIYGPAALALVPGESLAAHLRDALAEPERTWQAVIDTRGHLARHHSYERRLAEIEAIGTKAAGAGAGG